MEEDKATNTENVWEAIQIITGETFIYRKGFQEEADIKDVFRFEAGVSPTKQTVYQFSRFDFHPAKPAASSFLRLNRSVITFAWYVDPTSDVIIKLKEAMLQMNANKAGLVLPGQKG